MNNNKVRYTLESIAIINDMLEDIQSDAMISFEVINRKLSKDINIERCSFTLDDGAIGLLKAYYKSKSETMNFIKGE
ncbi:hypothetical protein [Clostridium sp. BJN0001]|uniref:hypothetical protein n=1 Tax=Clostridium sp. BJN0001 TaxID=2930219 RepID=UPI001FD53EDC|nr:hypothetical protein [Clostridium sp. BJN0001]